MVVLELLLVIRVLLGLLFVLVLFMVTAMRVMKATKAKSVRVLKRNMRGVGSFRCCLMLVGVGLGRRGIGGRSLGVGQVNAGFFAGMRFLVWGSRSRKAATVGGRFLGVSCSAARIASSVCGGMSGFIFEGGTSGSGRSRVVAVVRSMLDVGGMPVSMA